MPGVAIGRALAGADPRRLAGTVLADIVVGSSRKIGRHPIHGNRVSLATRIDLYGLSYALAHRLSATAGRDIDGAFEDAQGGAAVGGNGKDELGPSNRERGRGRSQLYRTLVLDVAGDEAEDPGPNLIAASPVPVLGS